MFAVLFIVLWPMDGNGVRKRSIPQWSQKNPTRSPEDQWLTSRMSTRTAPLNDLTVQRLLLEISKKESPSSFFNTGLDSICFSSVSSCSASALTTFTFFGAGSSLDIFLLLRVRIFQFVWISQPRWVQDEWTFHYRSLSPTVGFRVWSPYRCGAVVLGWKISLPGLRRESVCKANGLHCTVVQTERNVIQYTI